MELVFTKGSGKYDRMDVLRHGEQVDTIDCPRQGIIPHDMVHYAVESTLHRRGFIGRVHDGEPAAFQMRGDAESDGVERLVEVFQADGWSGWNTPPRDMLDLYQVTCRARACAPLAVTAGDIEAIRARLLELTGLWEPLAAGESLTLAFAR
ncbi:MAG TPA: hypothetical protein VFR91_05110 [Dyella sp.]|nr:hypothetical protein [Dyella sp.]